VGIVRTVCTAARTDPGAFEGSGWHTVAMLSLAELVLKVVDKDGPCTQDMRNDCMVHFAGMIAACAQEGLAVPAWNKTQFIQLCCRVCVTHVQRTKKMDSKPMAQADLVAQAFALWFKADGDLSLALLTDPLLFVEFAALKWDRVAWHPATLLQSSVVADNALAFNGGLVEIAAPLMRALLRSVREVVSRGTGAGERKTTWRLKCHLCVSIEATLGLVAKVCSMAMEEPRVTADMLGAFSKQGVCSSLHILLTSRLAMCVDTLSAPVVGLALNVASHLVANRLWRPTKETVQAFAQLFLHKTTGERTSLDGGSLRSLVILLEYGWQTSLCTASSLALAVPVLKQMCLLVMLNDLMAAEDIRAACMGATYVVRSMVDFVFRCSLWKTFARALEVPETLVTGTTPDIGKVLSKAVVFPMLWSMPAPLTPAQASCLCPDSTCLVCTFPVAGPDDSVPLVRLSCSCCAVYHVSCMMAWLSINDSCPLCRQAVLRPVLSLEAYLSRIYGKS
jgi:hypothetical protein